MLRARKREPGTNVLGTGRRPLRLAVGLLTCGLAPPVCSLSAQAASVERPGMTVAGDIVLVAGRADVRLVPRADFVAAVPRQTVVAGDELKTGEGGRLSMLFRDGTQIKMDGNSWLVISGVAAPSGKTGGLRVLLRLEGGEVWSRSKGTAEGLTIETPYATASIKGTEWNLSVGADHSRVTVMEGQVEVSNRVGAVTVGRDEQAVVTAHELPVKSHVVRPRDRIQWTYYLTEKKLLGYLGFTGAGSSEAEQLFNRGQLEPSAERFRAILAETPDDAAAHAGLGLVALRQGDAVRASTHLERSLRARKTVPAMAGTVVLRLSENRTDEAAALIREAVSLFPQEPLPRLLSAFLPAYQGAFAKALLACDQGLAVLPNDAVLLAFKTDLLFLLDRPAEAKATLDAFLREHPKSSQGYERLGFYHRFCASDAKQAKAALKTAIELDAFNDEAFSKLADLLREEGYMAQARRRIERALAIAPWNAMHHYNYGRLLLDIKLPQRARREFAAALQLDPTLSRAYLGEGLCLLKEGRIDEAIHELSTAALLEPNLAEIHAFLAVAFYRKNEIAAARDELQRARECDPLDSTPHQLEAILCNDTYEPSQSIQAARRMLELLPYRKASGETLLANTQGGAIAINEGLNAFDLPEWSLDYAQRALFANPFKSSSHFGVANAYRELGQVSGLFGGNEFVFCAYDEWLQGIALDVEALREPNRYRPMLSLPGHYATAGATLFGGDSHGEALGLAASGSFGDALPLSYGVEAYDDMRDGPVAHDSITERQCTLSVGYKPSFDQDVYVAADAFEREGDVPPHTIMRHDALDPDLPPDADQTFEEDYRSLTLGYHRRFSPVSHLLTSLRINHACGRMSNPTVAEDGALFADADYTVPDYGFSARHMLLLGERHRLSYGFDSLYEDSRYHERFLIEGPEGSERGAEAAHRRHLTVHLLDRWTVTPGLTLDGGLALSRFRFDSTWRSQDTEGAAHEESTERDVLDLDPAIGAAVALGPGGTLRAAYQKRTAQRWTGALAPSGTAGLVPPALGYGANRVEDIQGSVEYELTPGLFAKALFGRENVADLTSRERTEDESRLLYGRFAVNAILSPRFSASARYHYNDARYEDEAGGRVPGVSRHSGDARLVCVHPRQVYAWVRVSYRGAGVADADGARIADCVLTDLLVRKELLRKRAMISIGVENLFDREHQTFANAWDSDYWWYDGPLPGRGRTYSLRLEYRL